MNDQLDPQYAALTAAVTDSVSVANKAITLLNGLHAKLDAALANQASDPTAALAAVKAAVDALGAEKQTLADALTADALPVDPAPVPQPDPAPIPQPEPPAGTAMTQAEMEANAGGSTVTPDPAFADGSVGGVTNLQPGDEHAAI